MEIKAWSETTKQERMAMTPAEKRESQMQDWRQLPRANKAIAYVLLAMIAPGAAILAFYFFGGCAQGFFGAF